MQFKHPKLDENHSISLLSCEALSPYKQAQTPNNYSNVLFFHDEKGDSVDFTVMVHGAPTPLFLHSSLLSRTMPMVQDKAAERWKFASPHDIILNEAWLSDMDGSNWKVVWTYFSLYYGQVFTDFTVTTDDNHSNCVYVNQQQDLERIIDFSSWKRLLYMSDYFQDKTVCTLLIESMDTHLYYYPTSLTAHLSDELVLLLSRLLIQLPKESKISKLCVECALLQFGEQNPSSPILCDQNYIALPAHGIKLINLCE